MWSAQRIRLLLTKSGISRKIFVKIPNIKFHKIPSSVGRTDTREQTDRRTDMTKLRGAFRGYAKAPKLWHTDVLGTSYFVF